jgi:hypothetical protein
MRGTIKNNTKENIPVFEDKEAKRDIEFFPDIDFCYAIHDTSVIFHADHEGDPWSIFDSNGIHIGTFCTRKSKIFIWPECEIHGGEFQDGNCIKLTRIADKKESVKNAVRYAWLKWTTIKRKENKRGAVRFGENGYFFVPYNIEVKIYGKKGCYLVFNPKGLLVGKVEKKTINEEIWLSDGLYEGHWVTIREGKEKDTLSMAKELLWEIEMERL